MASQSGADALSVASYERSERRRSVHWGKRVQRLAPEAACRPSGVGRRLGGAETMDRQIAQRSSPRPSQPQGWRSCTGGKAHPAEVAKRRSAPCLEALTAGSGERQAAPAAKVFRGRAASPMDAVADTSKRTKYIGAALRGREPSAGRRERRGGIPKPGSTLVEQPASSKAARRLASGAAQRWWRAGAR